MYVTSTYLAAVCSALGVTVPGTVLGDRGEGCLAVPQHESTNYYGLCRGRVRANCDNIFANFVEGLLKVGLRGAQGRAAWGPSYHSCQGGVAAAHPVTVDTIPAHAIRFFCACFVPTLIDHNAVPASRHTRVSGTSHGSAHI